MDDQQGQGGGGMPNPPAGGPVDPGAPGGQQGTPEPSDAGQMPPAGPQMPPPPAEEQGGGGMPPSGDTGQGQSGMNQ